MKFHLNYQPKVSDFSIDHHHRILMLGSCFSENIGTKLKEHGFLATINPSGILFNPLSVYDTVNSYLHSETQIHDQIIRKGEEHFSFKHHSSVNAKSESELIEKIRNINIESHDLIKNTELLIITFGTAYYYHHQELNLAVANCHKQPASLFEKKLASVQEIVEKFNSLINNLHLINPAIKIIFTISPVKYLKDGLIENNISKSTLVLAVHELVKNSNCYYFPSYELVNDDLRDYRFYKEDLAHPNELAIDYVWEKFSETYFNEKTKALNELIYKLSKAVNHRKLHHHSSESEKLQQHMEELKKMIEKIDPILIKRLN